MGNSHSVVKILRDAFDAIREEGRRHYPYECCGAMLGRENKITEVIPIQNLEKERQNDRFVLDPKGYLEAEARAKENDLSILGFYHTHPDHPAKPSPTDRAYAWEEYIYLILSVDKSKPKDAGCFRLNGEDFEALQLKVVEEKKRLDLPKDV